MNRLGRLWPQKVRTRLALLYAVLFLISGSALLGLTYGLVAANLPATPVSPATRVDSNQLAKLSKACKQPYLDPGTVLACKQAFTAGGQTVRQRALESLLTFSLVGLGVMTVASGGLGWYMSGRVLRARRGGCAVTRRAGACAGCGRPRSPPAAPPTSTWASGSR